MKLILCSVFLAHGAVVYTVCAPLSGGVYQAPQHACELNVIVDKGTSDRGSISCNTTVNSRSHSKHRKNTITNGTSVARYALAKNDRAGQNGWQMSSDLSISTTRDIVIHFTVDAQGQVKNVTVTPFTSTAYQAICDQINQIRFTWRSSSAPPDSTRFEKKICVV